MIFWTTLCAILVIWLAYGLRSARGARADSCPYCGRTAELEEIERGGILDSGDGSIRACKECLYGKSERRQS